MDARGTGHSCERDVLIIISDLDFKEMVQSIRKISKRIEKDECLFHR